MGSQAGAGCQGHRNDRLGFRVESMLSVVGPGGGRIIGVTLAGPDGSPCAWMAGGNIVIVNTTLETSLAAERPRVHGATMAAQR